MGRRVFNLVAAVSLGLAVAVGAIWVRSCFVSDGVGFVCRGTPVVIASNDGEITMESPGGMVGSGEYVEPTGWQWITRQAQRSPAPIVVFSWYVHRSVRGLLLQFELKHWELVAVLAVLPGIWWKRRRRRMRRSNGNAAEGGRPVRVALWSQWGLLRRVMDMAARASLVLGVLACALWLRSYWVDESLRGTEGPVMVEIFSTYGGVSALAQWPADHSFPRGFLPSKGLRWKTEEVAETEVAEQALENHLSVQFILDPRHSIGVTLPHWLLALVLATWPLAWRRVKRRVGVPAGYCVRCGYDLRATPERCPECGTEVGAEGK